MAVHLDIVIGCENPPRCAAGVPWGPTDPKLRDDSVWVDVLLPYGSGFISWACPLTDATSGRGFRNATQIPAAQCVTHVRPPAVWSSPVC